MTVNFIIPVTIKEDFGEYPPTDAINTVVYKLMDGTLTFHSDYSELCIFILSCFERCDYSDKPDLQKPDIIAYLIFQEIPLLNIQTTVAS